VAERSCIGFIAAFGGRPLRVIIARTLAEAVQLCRLIPCVEYRGNACSPKMAPHAHIPAEFFSPEPTMKGGVPWYRATIPLLGMVECTLDGARPEPPPIYFTEVTVIELEPARQE